MINLKYPISVYITVIATYKGKPFTKDLLEENPSLKDEMPSDVEFDSTYASVVKKVHDTGNFYNLYVSEHGIFVKQLN